MYGCRENPKSWVVPVGVVIPSFFKFDVQVTKYLEEVYYYMRSTIQMYLIAGARHGDQCTTKFGGTILSPIV